MPNYKVSVSDILNKEPGSSVEFAFPLSGKFDDNISFTKSSELFGRITHIDDYLLVDFEVSEYQLQEACVRCLTEIKQITSIDRASESYSLTDAKENHFELISEDSETHEQMFDLEPLLSQELVLSKQAHALCKDDCAGLCQQCGKNKNTKSCSCKPLSPTDSPFAKLKDSPHFKS